MICIILENSKHVVNVHGNQMSADLRAGYSYREEKGNDGYLMNDILGESKFGEICLLSIQSRLKV